MVKVTPDPLQPTAVIRSRGNFLEHRASDGSIHVQKWPRKRKRRSTPAQAYKEAEFGRVAQWAAAPEPVALQTAIELCKGTDNVPRDLIMQCSFGTMYDVYLPDGTLAEKYRMVAPNAQLILDQVTDEVNTMLWRSPAGWVALQVGNSGEVLTFTDSGPIWEDNGGAQASHPPTPLTQPYLSDANRYASVVTFGTGSVSGQAFIANRMCFIPVCLPQSRNLTKIGINVSTLLAGSNIRLGLFADDHPGGGPGTLLADGGNVSSATAGHKDATINYAAKRGLYWLCAWPSGTQAAYALAASWSVGGTGWDMSLTIPTTAVLLTRTQAFGSAFGNETSQTHTVGGYANTPIIGMR